MSSYWPLISVIFDSRIPTCIFVLRNRTLVGRHSSLGIATRCGLSGPGIESRWVRDFPKPSRPTPGPTQPPIRIMDNGSFPGVKQPRRGVDHSPPSSAEVKGRVELHVYSSLWAFVACSRANFTFATGLSPCLKFTAYTHYWKGSLVIRDRSGSSKTFRKISLVMNKCVVQGFIAYSIIRSDIIGRIKYEFHPIIYAVMTGLISAFEFECVYRIANTIFIFFVMPLLL